jgi:hypothetical protein
MAFHLAVSLEMKGRKHEEQALLFHLVAKLREIASQRDETMGQPDAGKLKKARKFAKEIMGKYGK